MLRLAARIRKHNLTLSFLVIIFLFLLFGVATLREVVTLGDLTRTIYEHPLVVSNASLAAAVDITKMHRSMKDVLLAHGPAEREAALQALAEGEAHALRELDIIRNEILGSEGQELEKETRRLFVEWKPIRDDVVRFLASGDLPAAVHVTQTRGAEHVAALEAKMLELTSYARNKADGFMAAAEGSQSSLETTTAVLTIAGVLLSALIALLATLRVLRDEKMLLAEKDKLLAALDEIKTLRGIIPICSHCKQIRNDEGSWTRIEEYIRTHSEASFSHGICPDCLQEHYPEVSATMRARAETEQGAGSSEGPEDSPGPRQTARSGG